MSYLMRIGSSSSLLYRYLYYDCGIWRIRFTAVSPYYDSDWLPGLPDNAAPGPADPDGEAALDTADSGFVPVFVVSSCMDSDVCRSVGNPERAGQRDVSVLRNLRDGGGKTS